MRNDRHLAIKLRKQGLGYNKISQELGIPKSTLSDWLSGQKWSNEIRDDLARRANYIARKRLRLINQERRKMWERWREEAREEARKDFPKLAKDPLFIAGTMLYWGEGDSNIKNGQIGFTNTNSNMMRLFSLFLQGPAQVPREKIRVQMILYPDLNEEECKRFWSRETDIPTDQFYKTQFIQGRHPTKRLSHGIFMIRFSSRQLKEKIAVWIDLFQKQYPLKQQKMLRILTP